MAYGPLRLTFVFLAKSVPKCPMSSGPYGLIFQCPQQWRNKSQDWVICFNVHHKRSIDSNVELGIYINQNAHNKHATANTIQTLSPIRM